MPIYLKRAIEGQIKKDVAKKMVFLAGPRQTGKTSLSLHIFDIASVLDTDRYLNWDVTTHRERITTLTGLWWQTGRPVSKILSDATCLPGAITNRMLKAKTGIYDTSETQTSVKSISSYATGMLLYMPSSASLKIINLQCLCDTLRINFPR